MVCYCGGVMKRDKNLLKIKKAVFLTAVVLITVSFGAGWFIYENDVKKVGLLKEVSNKASSVEQDKLLCMKK